MALIDNEIINQIRNSINIVDVINEYVPLTAKGRNFFGVCPFHNDHSPSMSVSPDKQIYTCFSCGATGNVFTFLQDFEHIPFLEAVKRLSLKTGISLGVNISSPKEPKKTKENEIYNLTQKFYQNNLKTKEGLKAREYLHKRNFNDDIIEKFAIGLSLNVPDNLLKLLENKGYDKQLLDEIGLINNNQDYFRNRIMFPIKDYMGQIVGYSGRVYNNEDSAKYVNSRASSYFKKGEILYNYHLAKDRVRINNAVIVVEGFMDVIRLSSIGVDNAVALMGTALTKEQIILLKKLRCPVILCLDNDEAGLNATFAAGDQLFKENIETLVIRLEDYNDPDDYIVNKGKEAFELNLNSAQSYLDYKIKYLKTNFGSNDSKQIADNINDLINLINPITDSIYKNILIEKIVKEFNLDQDLLKAKLNTQEAKIIIPKEINKRKKTRINKACEAILYIMLSNPKYIKIFDKNMGYFPISIYNSLLNEIRTFYSDHSTINFADFLTYINEDEKLSELVKEIIAQSDEIVNEEEFDNYLSITKKAVFNKRIDKLKEDIEKTDDLAKKIAITNKIAELKKEV